MLTKVSQTQMLTKLRQQSFCKDLVFYTEFTDVGYRQAFFSETATPVTQVKLSGMYNRCLLKYVVL